MRSLFDASGLPVAYGDASWCLEEARTYRLRGVNEATWDGIPLVKNECGDLLVETGHRVGRASLEWRTGLERGRIDVDILPRAEKLSPELWLCMIRELDQWLAGASVGVGGARHGGVAAGGVPSILLAEALLPLMPIFEDALVRLADSLRRRQWVQIDDEPLRRVRRVERPTSRWVARHPQAAGLVEPWRCVAFDGSGSSRVPVVRSLDRIDHPANRYMHWIVRRVMSRLGRVAERLKVNGRDEQALWRRSQAMRLDVAVQRAEVLLGKTHLSKVPQSSNMESALAVIAGDPCYTRLHRLARLFLSQQFALDGDGLVSNRPSYGIYELWCLSALTNALRAMAGFDWRENDGGWRCEPESTGAGFALIGRREDGVLELHFNRTFVSFGRRGGDDVWTLSKERRPDFAIAWKPAGGARPRWVVLDAKYRVGANLIEAFESLHLYRDALRWNSGGGAARAGALLTPACTDDSATYFGASYRESFGLGAFEWRPGGETSTLIGWLTATLGLPKTATDDLSAVDASSPDV